MAALRKAPSRELWRFLLFDLLSGEQELESYLGHIESYEEIIMQVYDAYDGANPEKPQKSEDYFNIELEDIVRGWRPKETKPERYFDAMLRLISAFTPPSGFHRILGQMEQYGKFNLAEDDPEEQRKLTELALTALQNYYLTHPAKNAVDPAFKAYVRFLRLKLKDQELSPHACRRLIELTLLEVDAEEVAETLRQHPEELLTDLLRAFLVDHTSLMRDGIPKLFVLCLKESLKDARLFLESARKFGASLEALPFDASEEEFETPALVTAAGDRVDLYLPADNMEIMITLSELMKEDLRPKAVVKLEALMSSRT